MLICSLDGSIWCIPIGLKVVPMSLLFGICMYYISTWTTRGVKLRKSEWLQVTKPKRSGFTEPVVGRIVMFLWSVGLPKFGAPSM